MPDIRHRIEIAAADGSIYALVSSGHGFARWRAADVTATADGPVEIGFFRRSTVYRLSPVELKPSSRAVWHVDSGKEWAGTKIVFELRGRADKTLLRFTHADWREKTDYFWSCNTTWGGLLFRLKAAAEGRSPGPLFSTDGMAY
jgi:hypothetical protein